MKKNLFLHAVLWCALPVQGQESLTGNAGTNPTTNFLRTRNNQPLLFRDNNQFAAEFTVLQAELFWLPCRQKHYHRTQ